MSDEKVLFGKEFEEEIDFGDLDEDDAVEEKATADNYCDMQSDEEATDDTYEISYEEFGISEEDDDSEIYGEEESDPEEDVDEDIDEYEEEEEEQEDENDTVAMVSRNSERVQTGKSSAYTISGQEREITVEQPVRVAPAAPPPHINNQETVRKESVNYSAPKAAKKKDSKIAVVNTVISVVTLCAVGFGLLSGFRRTKELEKLLEEKTQEIESLRKKSGQGGQRGNKRGCLHI